MASKVSICNAALSRLGGATITSLTDGTRPAQLCNTFFDLLADRVQSQGAWSASVRRVALARTTNTPSFGYTYEFQLPVDPKCLRVLTVNEDYEGQIEFKIEGDKLLTDEASVSIRYIAKLTDTEDWDALMTEAVEILLASYLAKPLTGESTVAQALKQEYAEFIQNNLALDNQQGTPQVIMMDDSIRIRN